MLAVITVQTGKLRIYQSINQSMKSARLALEAELGLYFGVNIGVAVGVGDGRRGEHVPQPKNREKYFSDNYYVKFGHFRAKIM